MRADQADSALHKSRHLFAQIRQICVPISHCAHGPPQSWCYIRLVAQCL